MSSLLLGKDRVSEAEVMAVPAVPFTKTFHPVHHRDFIQSVREGVKAVGLEIVKSEFVLAAEGKKCSACTISALVLQNFAGPLVSAIL